MTLLNISDIIRKENYIYYRREFTATVVFQLGTGNLSGKIEFTIETAPTGKKDIQIKLIDSIDYPLLPLLRSIKDAVTELEKEGKLP
ncbi:hypothetical protein K7J14_09190 [Treponema zuelzerae]|uniref:Uncharacterized protein n=1 Tax=Teretinema zuelzerae TaxID=156 RepID=A0AAE3EJD5_9SPIR|nr:hypothetical protein [Teretinema zuelzerae]MBN2810892.1 hypothetical protein [Spirochaetales bacterium]MCD1654876.1 hypothetical protein [Teretinema zuelzerae]